MLVVLIVTVALLTVFLRALLINVDQFEEQISDFVWDAYQVKFSIGPMNSRWGRYGPELSLTQFTIHKQDSLPFYLSLDQAYIRLDFWESVLAMTPVIKQVDFAGVDVTLNLDYRSVSEEDIEVVDFLYELFFEYLDDIRVTTLNFYIDKASHRSPPVILEEFRWVNRGDEHIGQGEIHLGKQFSAQEKIEVLIQLKGDGSEPESMTGDLYVSSKKLNLGNWLAQNRVGLEHTSQLNIEGEMNFEMWGRIENRRLSHAILQFHPSFLQWQTENVQQEMKIGGGVFQWQPVGEYWHLTNKGFSISTNKKPWENFDISMRYGQDIFDFSLTQLNIEQLKPLFVLFPEITEKKLSDLIKANPTCHLENLRVHINDDGRLLYFAELNDFSLKKNASFLGFTPIYAEIYGKDDLFSLYLPEQDITLMDDREFHKPLELSIQDTWVRMPTNLAWSQLEIPELSLTAEPLEANIRLLLKWGENDPASLALSGDARIHDLSQVANVLPKQALGEDLFIYLRDALAKGSADEAQLLWLGSFSRYPFVNNDGMFQAAFKLKDSVFKFDSEWPEINQLTLDALFQDDAMYLLIEEGFLQSVDASDTSIVIPHLSAKSMLNIQSQLKPTGKAITEVMKSSPLASSVGKTLDIVQISGRVEGDLNLQIPLYETSDSPLIDARVDFQKNPVYIDIPGIMLDKLDGSITVFNEQVVGQNLKALLYEQPLNLSFVTRQDDDEDVYSVQIDMESKWKLDGLSEELNNPLQNFYRGDMDWNGSLNLLIGDNIHVDADIVSNLEQVELDLPPPFDKKKGKKDALRLTVVADDTETNIQAQLSNKAELTANVNYKKKNIQTSYDLMLGRLFNQKDKRKNHQGTIHFDLDTLELEPWIGVIQTFAKYESNSEKSSLPPLKLAQGNINNLSGYGYQFGRADIKARPVNYGWLVDVDSKPMEGMFTFYPDWNQQGMKVNAKRVNWDRKFAQQTTGDGDGEGFFRDLPPLAIDIARLNFKGQSFRNVMMQGKPISDGYRVTRFSLKDKHSELNLSMDWKKSQQSEMTKVNFQGKTDNFKGLLQSFDMDLGLQSELVEAQGDLQWRDDPLKPNWKTMTGYFKYSGGQGVIEDVDDQGARLFSILSLNSLVRKLSLDFSDVFDKGFHFDKFNGTFKLSDGKLETDDTFIDGVAAAIDIQGEADLKTEILNYDIKVIPRVGSSLPAFAFLAGGPVTAITTFFVTKALQPVVEVISQLNYKVTGTIDKPVIKEISRDKKEVTVPEKVLKKQ